MSVESSLFKSCFQLFYVLCVFTPHLSDYLLIPNMFHLCPIVFPPSCVLYTSLLPLQIANNLYDYINILF